MHRKVLIITTHFPPDRHVGARRPAKLAKYLTQFGWQPIILTVPSREYVDGIDESLIEDLSKNYKIYRVPRGTNSNRKDPAFLRKEKLFLRIRAKIGKILLPSYSVRWVLNSIKEGIKIVESEKVDLIFSTEPDSEARIAAFFLRIITNKKFVCDFRDPTRWMLNRNFSLEEMIMLFFLKVTLWKASAVVCISKVLRKRLAEEGWLSNKKKYVTIYNGFDIVDFTGIQQRSDNSKFTITYVGSWGGQRDPKYLLESFESLLQKKPILQKRIKLVLVGWVKRDKTMEKWLKERLSKGILKKTVEVKGFLSYRKALSEMLQSSVLLTCNSEKVMNKGCLESKIFEYLYSGKPIIALSVKDSEMGHFLEDMDAGVIVPPTEPELISRAILSMYQDHSKGRLRGASRDDVKQFERKQLAKRLAELFNAIMNGQKNLMNIGW